MDAAAIAFLKGVIMMALLANDHAVVVMCNGSHSLIVRSEEAAIACRSG